MVRAPAAKPLPQTSLTVINGAFGLCNLSQRSSPAPQQDPPQIMLILGEKSEQKPPISEHENSPIPEQENPPIPELPKLRAGNPTNPHREHLHTRPSTPQEPLCI